MVGLFHHEGRRVFAFPHADQVHADVMRSATLHLVLVRPGTEELVMCREGLQILHTGSNVFQVSFDSSPCHTFGRIVGHLPLDVLQPQVQRRDGTEPGHNIPSLPRLRGGGAIFRGSLRFPSSGSSMRMKDRDRGVCHGIRVGCQSVSLDPIPDAVGCVRTQPDAVKHHARSSQIQSDALCPGTRGEVSCQMRTESDRSGQMLCQLKIDSARCVQKQTEAARCNAN